MGHHADHGSERRQQARVAAQIPFFCYVDGQRFDSDTLNISAGGAFLATDERIPLKTPVLLLPRRARSSKPALLIVGHVVRQQEEPEMGVGIQWGKVLSRKGLALIIKLASLLPEMFPEQLPAPSRELMGLDMIGYSFKKNEYFEPAMPGDKTKRSAGKVDVAKARMALEQASAPAGQEAEAAPVAAPPVPAQSVVEPTPVPAGAQTGRASLDTLPQPPAPPDANTTQRLLHPSLRKRSPEDGPVSDVLGYQQVMIPVEFPVRVRRSGVVGAGHLLQVGLQNCFVAMPGLDPMTCTPFEEVQVIFPVELDQRFHEVTLCGELLAISDDPRTDREGLSLSLRSVKQVSAPGLYERYVKYLYYHMINQA